MSSEPYNVYPATTVEAPPIREGEMPRPVPGTVEGPVAKSDAGSKARSLLLKAWKARGLFAVSLAILIAWIGEMALLTQNDYETATRNYIIGIVLVILGLLHPKWPLFGRKQKAEGETQTAEGSEQKTAVVESDATILATDVPGNGNVPASDGEMAIIARPVGSSHTGSGSSGPITAPLGEITPVLPTRPVRSQNAQPGVTAEQPVEVGRLSTIDGQPAARPWARYKALRAQLGWKATAAGMGIVVILAIVAASQFNQNSGSVLGGWLWFASLVVLVLTFVGAEGWPRGDGLLPGPWDDWFGPGVPRIPFWVETALVVVIMGVAVAMRVWNLEYHPGIFGDEGERGIDARAIFNGQPDNIFGSGWWGVPNLYFYTVAASFRIFGDNLIGDRMVSVISGLVAVWFVYKTGRLLWGPRAGLMAGAMLAVSPLALQFSRLAGESSVTGALWAVGAYYLFLALRYRRWLDFALAGFFWSINLYYYPSGKLVIGLFAAVVLYCLIRWHINFIKRYALGFALMTFAFLLTFMPYAFYSIQTNWAAFIGRATETSIFSPQNQQGTFARYGLPYDPAMAGQPLVQSLTKNPTAWGGLIYQQARESLDVLYRRGDQVYYYREDRNNGIVLQPLLAAIALLALAYAVWKLFDGRFGLALIWFAVGLSGSYLTIDVPNLQRFTGAWPAMMLFPAALLDRAFASSWPLSLSFAKKWAAIPLAAFCIYLGVDAYQEYFVYFPTTCPYCTATVQARYVQALGQDYKGYQMGVGGYDVYFGYGSTRFVAKDVEGEDMLAAADDLPVIDNNGKGLAFIIFTNNTEYLPLLNLYYPMGIQEDIKGVDGSMQFTSIKVPREQVDSTRVMHASYTPANGQAITRDEAGIGTSSDRPLPPGLAYPVQAEWKGGLVAPQYGVYTFSLDGNTSDGKLELDGETILTATVGGPQPTVQRVLAKGMHDIKLTGSLADANAKLNVLWSPGGSSLSEIDRIFLWGGPTGGLSGSLGPLGASALDPASPDPYSGQLPTQLRSDPFIGFREASTKFTNASYLARWQGKLNVPVEGDYAFSMTGNPGAGLVLIDGASVFGNGATSPVAHLTAGLHDIDVRYASPAGPARIELLWTVPGGSPAIIPPTALVPSRRSWKPEEMPTAPAASLPANLSQSAGKQPDLAFGNGDLQQPRGIAVDKQGNVYVGDRGNHRVVVYSPDGKVVRTWGKQAPQPKEGEPAQAVQPGEFGQINDVAVGDDGTVYVFDDNSRVQAFNQQGEYKGSFEPEQLGLYGPNGIAAGGKPTNPKGIGVYIAATGQNRILHTPSIDVVKGGKASMPQDGESISIGDGSTDHLEQPVDVVTDPSGNGVIYSIDLKDRIVQLTPPSTAGQPWTISKQWSVPVGRADGGARLAISDDGTKVYMSDPDKNRVDTLDVSSGRISYFGSQGGAPGQFGIASGIAVGPDGKIYVVDSQNNNVQVFTP